MDLIRDAVNRVREIAEHGGCGEGEVLLDVNPVARNCQFERGACMTAEFGGRTGDFVTFDPIRARTKLTYLFDAPLDTPATRSAASAIVNAITGFFCLSRVLHACSESCHGPCLAQLSEYLEGKRIYCAGDIPGIEVSFRNLVVQAPEMADVILIGCEGIIAPGTGDIFEEFHNDKTIICIGSSVAGVAKLSNIDHWCPYGRSF